MFSAKGKNDGLLYISGRMDNPKSQQYTCPNCEQDVSHVSQTKRSMAIDVSEHFRHKSGSNVTHPHKRFTWQVGNIMHRLLDNFNDDSTYSIETDKILHVPQTAHSPAGLDVVVDLIVKEKFGDQNTTAFFVESEQYNSNHVAAAMRSLSAQGIATMLIMSAYSNKNPEGKYFRQEYRQHTKTLVKKLGDNERALYDLQGHNVYFNHDHQTFNVVTFKDYEEYHEEEFISQNSGFRIPPGNRTFKKFKLSNLVSTLREFDIARIKRGNILIAVPSMHSIERFIRLEQEAKAAGDADKEYAAGERIGIMLDSMSEERRRELSKIYGPAVLGAYYVK